MVTVACLTLAGPLYYRKSCCMRMSVRGCVHLCWGYIKYVIFCEHNFVYYTFECKCLDDQRMGVGELRRIYIYIYIYIYTHNLSH